MRIAVQPSARENCSSGFSRGGPGSLTEPGCSALLGNSPCRRLTVDSLVMIPIKQKRKLYPGA